MSKTKRAQRKTNNFGAYLFITALLTAFGIYKEGRIPLMPGFYIRYALLAAGLCIAVLLIKTAVSRSRLAGASMKRIDNMTGEEFEQYLGILYKRRGYKVEFTPGTMDFGADLILTKGRTKSIVQAKRYRNMVGEAAVQQVLAAKGYYNADQCLVVTNSDYTAAAKELAAKTEVKLIDRNKLGKSDMYI